MKPILFPIASFWKDIFDIIPNIETSFALLAFFGGISVLVAIYFFRTESPVRRERIFIYMMLFLFAIFVALVAGFRTGEAFVEPEIVENVIEVPADVDENSITLSSSSIQQLEAYIEEQGRGTSKEEKQQVVEDALDNYLNVYEPTSTDEPASTADSDLSDAGDTAVAVKSSSETSSLQAGFNLELRVCQREAPDKVICDFSVTNQKEDTTLRLYARGTQIADANGDLYDASKVKFGTGTSSSYERPRLVKDVPVNGSLTFTGVPTEVNTLNLLDIYGYADSDSSNLRFKFLNIPITG